VHSVALVYFVDSCFGSLHANFLAHGFREGAGAGGAGLFPAAGRSLSNVFSRPRYLADTLLQRT